MVDSPSLLLAFAAGFVSFVSPCCLPLVPGYLAAISPSGPSGSSGAAALPGVSSIVARSLIFVASFSAVFIALGLSATALGTFLLDNQFVLREASGVVIITMGVLFVATPFFLRLNRDFRPPGLMQRAASGGPVIAGIAFAFAWTPCVGPTLGAILGLASASSSTPTAALLLTVYSAGLALPFLLSAAGFGAAQRAFRWLRGHYVFVQCAAGVTLVVMGVLVYTNQLFWLNREALQLLQSLGLDFYTSL